jgi:hypothetical protein
MESSDSGRRGCFRRGSHPRIEAYRRLPLHRLIHDCVIDTAVNMTKLVCAAGLVLALSACSHTPMRTFDCEAVLGLRLGQSPDEVKALIGKPYLEEAGETWWEKERVADYRMLFEEPGSRRRWLEGSVDLFHIDFLRNRLVRAGAYRSGFRSHRLALALGSQSYGQPSPKNQGRPEPVQAEVGPAFREAFQCRAGVPLDKAQAEFEAQVKAR